MKVLRATILHWKNISNDTNDYKNGKNNSGAASVFNEPHIFNEASLSISEKRKEEKNWTRTNTLATHNSMNKENVC